MQQLRNDQYRERQRPRAAEVLRAFRKAVQKPPVGTGSLVRARSSVRLKAAGPFDQAL